MQTSHSTSDEAESLLQHRCRVCGSAYKSVKKLERHMSRRHFAAPEDMDILAEMFDGLDLFVTAREESTELLHVPLEGRGDIGSYTVVPQDTYTFVEGSFWLDWVPSQPSTMFQETPCWCYSPGSADWNVESLSKCWSHKYTSPQPPPGETHKSQRDGCDISITGVFNVLLDV